MLDGMGLIQLYSTAKASTTSPDISQNWHEKNAAFCNCSPNVSDDKQCCSARRKSESSIPLGVCRCGEDTCRTFNWRWDKELKQPQTMFIGETVSFHPCYSQGTSVIRGDTELAKDHIHYWEIKIVHWFSGTDLMVGVGTDQVNIREHRYKFASVLGIDSNSWGFSHRGVVQHKNIRKCYGKMYTKQCIVGIYLDLFRGHLEFYVNRIPQGIAYKNIPTDKGTPIYPMACSTSARSSIRLINASSHPDCLQFRCMKVIAKYPQLINEVQQMPGLASLCESLWFLLPKERYSYKRARPEPRTSAFESSCSGESTCSTNRCSSGTSSSFSYCDDGDRAQNVDDHSYINYDDDFDGMVVANDHDHNDSMEDDLFAATIQPSVSGQSDDGHDENINDTL